MLASFGTWGCGMDNIFLSYLIVVVALLTLALFSGWRLALFRYRVVRVKKPTLHEWTAFDRYAIGWRGMTILRHRQSSRGPCLCPLSDACVPH